MSREQQHDAVQRLGLPHRQVLVLRRGDVVAQQARVAARVMASETHTELCLCVPDSAPLLLQRAAWLQLPLLEQGRYRLCRLDTLQPLESTTNTTTTSPPRLSLSRSQLLSSAPVTLTPSVALQPLWPHCRAKPLVAYEPCIMQAWLAALMDASLLRKPLELAASGRLQSKWLQWLDAHLAAPQHQMAHVAALVLARQWRDAPHRYGELRWAREWVDFQLLLFSTQLPEPAALHDALAGHVAWIAQHGHTGWCHAWRLYHVESGAWWLHQDDRFVLSARWMPLLELRSVQLRRGRLAVDRATFDAVVAPALYRLVLGDLLHEARRQSLAQGALADFESELGGEAWGVERQWLNAAMANARDLALLDARWDQRHAWCIQTSWHSSPVQRHLLKWCAAREDKLASDAGRAPIVLAEHVADIEDLAALAPPCMRKVMQPGHWAKNWDRFNMVAYLWDAGYSRAQVTQYMCRARQGRQEEVNTIGSLYDACKRRERSEYGRVSNTCGTLMNARYSSDTQLRCAWVEQSDDGVQQRHDYGKTEKAANCATCAERGQLTDTKVYHPLDYVEAQLQKARRGTQ